MCHGLIHPCAGSSRILTGCHAWACNACNDSAEPSRFRPPKRKLWRWSSCEVPDVGTAGCRTVSTHLAHGVAPVISPFDGRILSRPRCRKGHERKPGASVRPVHAGARRCHEKASRRATRPSRNRIPEKVSVNARASTTAGLAKEVDAVNQ